MQVPFIGPKLAKSLVAYCGSAEEVFKQKKQHLLKIPGIGESISNQISKFNDFERAENELEFIEKHKIKPLLYFQKEYPERLKDIEEAPVLLYFKGNIDLNAPKVIGIVGTRKASNYGRDMTERLVAELAAYNVVVVSGLAFGIDHAAHKAALAQELATVGVLAHGLDSIYPWQHRSLAANMVNNGGLLTEYISQTQPKRENFPERNRIVAGMVDGILLVETAKRGGALITAEIAYSYNREVFAVPGRVGDEYSEGCNNFIRIQKAYLINSAADIAYHLGWDIKDQLAFKKKIDLSHLKGLEKELAYLIQENEKIHFDQIATKLNISSSDLSVKLLDLEFSGVIQALPGNNYRIKN